MYFLAYQELFTLRDNPTTSPPRKDLDALVTGPPFYFYDVLDLPFLEELLSLHRGQGLEILWRDSLQCPSEEEYISMVNNSQFSSISPTEPKFTQHSQKLVDC